MSLLIRSFNSSLCFSLLVSRFCACPVFILDSQIISARVLSLSFLSFFAPIQYGYFSRYIVTFFGVPFYCCDFQSLVLFCLNLISSPKSVVLTNF